MTQIEFFLVYSMDMERSVREYASIDVMHVSRVVVAVWSSSVRVSHAANAQLSGKGSANHGRHYTNIQGAANGCVNVILANGCRTASMRWMPP